MAHEILSVKLCELDKKFAQLHSRIQLTEILDSEEIGENIRTLQRECAENKLTLHNKMKFSRAQKVKLLLKTYDEVEEIIQGAQEEIRESMKCDREEDLPAEELLLLAEYALDFAVQAADGAMLISMEAIRAQMEQEEKEE